MTPLARPRTRIRVAPSPNARRGVWQYRVELVDGHNQTEAEAGGFTDSLPGAEAAAELAAAELELGLVAGLPGADARRRQTTSDADRDAAWAAAELEMSRRLWGREESTPWGCALLALAAFAVAVAAAASLVLPHFTP